MYALLATALFTFCVAKRIYSVIKAHTLDFDRCLPRLIMPFQPLSALGAFLPKLPFHRPMGFPWDERSSMYRMADLKTIMSLPLFLGESMVYTSSLTFFHQCLSLNAPFHKPAGMSILEIMGENVVTTQGEAWKRHRRITAPAFNYTTYRNVWDTAANVYSDMIAQEGWLNVDKTPVADFNKITHKLALFLISIVGFNIPMSWSEPPRDDKGGLSTQAMMFEVSSTILLRSLLPKWSYHLGIRKFKIIDEAYTAFEKFMRERITGREAQLKELHAIEGASHSDIADSVKDVFGRLVDARLTGGKYALSDEEIIGNCFIFMFAGHETTANALAAALALLSVNLDKQDWVYQSIKSAIGDRVPTFDDYDVLENVLGCFYEALRMYPAAYMTNRVASEDLSIAIPHKDKPTVMQHLSLKKDTTVIMDFIGMSYDPQVFPDPEVFRPERWAKLGETYASSPSITEDTEAGEVSGSFSANTLEGFIGFSYGPRTCLGHKFAKVEAVAFLTLVLREWRVEPALKKGETTEMWKEKVLKRPILKLTMNMGNVPLKLVRRK